ncbi:class I SAM-dependent methyltransferase [Rhizobium azibense]|uniref:Methyltransferase family protein n=1 Tax=Rhizobium azibense TaxID=1136135 RepID=A0A4R3RA91_9HYPH|nr:class I SAM-dependent methyltransferase [Rhizobium azibense]TCU32300.1 methyltransferase family protein [Rhizobium azibense]
MPDYAAIYDDVFQRVKGYRNPLGSPGLRTALRYSELIRSAGTSHLDVGCGMGYVVETLRNPPFKKMSRGADVSVYACEESNKRLGKDVVLPIVDGRLPYSDETFDLVTCFDVLEHLDETDIRSLQTEMRRVLKPGGLWMLNISLRASGTKDINGESVHRTVRPPQWWDDILDFDKYEVDKADSELTGWLRA